MQTIVFVAPTMVTMVTANLNAQEIEKRFGFEGTFQYSFLPVKVKSLSGGLQADDNGFRLNLNNLSVRAGILKQF